MAETAHVLVTYKYQPTSYPQYRFYCECSCGFQCRLATKEASQSQFDNHLRAHGQTEYFSRQTPAALNISEETKPIAWSPFSAK
jgi:hypothetical protein